MFIYWASNSSVRTCLSPLNTEKCQCVCVCVWLYSLHTSRRRYSTDWLDFLMLNLRCGEKSWATHTHTHTPTSVPASMLLLCNVHFSPQGGDNRHVKGHGGGRESPQRSGQHVSRTSIHFLFHHLVYAGKNQIFKILISSYF